MDFSDNIKMLAIQFVPFMMAVVFHEYAHGYVANKWGDNTAKAAGRLTLNPLPHIDPIGTVVFPVMIMLTGLNVLFGWARPVPINPSLFRKYRPGLFWVSFAGPGMNFILAIVSALLFGAVARFVPEDFYLFEPLVLMAHGSVYLNFALGIFNLLPLPPLDGSKIIESFLSYEATRKYESIAQYSFFILMALILTGVMRFVMVPALYLGGMLLTGARVLFGVG